VVPGSALPENVAYNSPIAVRFTGRLDPDALEWTWNQIICRHDLLRTVFELHQGDPAQYPTPKRKRRVKQVAHDSSARALPRVSLVRAHAIW
jgi:Condensation domain